MKPLVCPHEDETLAAVLEGRWPAATDAELRAHAAQCPACSEIISVTAALREERRALLAEAVVPEPGQVWWRAQLRARREAVLAANLPITAAQVVAFAVAMVILGVCIGATSPALQTLMTALRAKVADFHPLALLAAPGSLQVALLLGALGVVLLVPTVYFFARSRR